MTNKELLAIFDFFRNIFNRIKQDMLQLIELAMLSLSITD